MPRLPRLFLSQSYYHIVTRGNNRHRVFETDEDYKYYLELIKKYKAEFSFDLFHYCLMSNHVHLLIKTDKASDFSAFMKKLNLAYFHYYNKLYGWVGHFWQNRFKSQPVGKDEYFIQCGKYIELNPVRANMVAKPEDYPYSSYSYYAKGDSNELITRDLFYDYLGNNELTRQQNYKDMVILDLVGENYSKQVWGSNQQRYQEDRKIRHYEKTAN
ncbi:transposase [Patescibacteria group bacterium]|nr:transposase [Patescibacteria group bacterium]